MMSLTNHSHNQITSLRDICTENQNVSELVLGLTGNPGAGKSTISQHMQEKGAIILDGDHLGYEMLQTQSPVFNDIIQAFGNTILNKYGEIDRTKLGAIVFHEPEQLDTLNKIVHPPMLQRIQERIQQFRNKHENGPLVLDAALIYEWKIETWFDAVIVVAASKTLRHQRYIKHKGSTSEKLNQREASQLAEDIKINRADILIMNDEDELALQYKINQLFM